MSNVITNLCKPLQVAPPRKCVLMALADRADDDGCCWPSLAALSEWTCFSRTTVIEALKWLESVGLIVLMKTQGKQHRCLISVGTVALFSADPSGNRTGTRPPAVPVEGDDEDLTRTAPAPVGIAGEPLDPSGSRTTPSASRTGTPAVPVRLPDHPPSGNRTGTRPPAVPPRTGAVPETSITSTKTPIKTSEEDMRKPPNKSGFDPLSIELPEWLPASAWAMWVKDRADRKKPVTEAGAKLQVRGLERARDAGHDPVLVIEKAIEFGWQGLYPAKDGSTLATISRHASPGDSTWLTDAGFASIAEAQNARCHVGNFREFRDGKRIVAEVQA